MRGVPFPLTPNPSPPKGAREEERERFDSLHLFLPRPVPPARLFSERLTRRCG